MAGSRQPEGGNFSYVVIVPKEWGERIERSEIVQSRDKMPIYGGKWMSIVTPVNLSPL